MQLTFLYHRVNEGKYATSYKIMKRHLKFLSENHKIIVPGDPISFFKMDVCITFDDAYYDFYHYVFPLLKKYKIKAVLGVPVKFILEDTSIDPKIRLSVAYHDAMKGDTYKEKAPFCTWKEMKEMVDSGHVVIASHSYSHINLLQPDVDLDHEIIESKKILETKLQTKINTFIYPLGKFNEKIHARVKKHYRYAMRIGSTWNITWQNISKITYRIISDSLERVDQFLNWESFVSYLWFYLLNSYRKR